MTVPVGGEVNIRAGVDFQPISIEQSISDVDYDLNLPSPSFSALLDWHPGGGGFRATGGVVSFANELELEALLTEDVDIGGRDYSPIEIGTLIGSLGTARFAPYLGIGWGDSPSGGFSFSADLGVAFHGTPDVGLRATGPIGDDPDFLTRLEAEIEEVNDDIESFKVYPVLNLGFGFGL